MIADADLRPLIADHNRKSEIGGWRLAIGNQQPATSNQQPATSNQQPAIIYPTDSGITF
ncbi:hypothetical protein MRS60_29410 [Burkholderia pyrrocinia]|uniref:hypothetical protein n=1 Tax=Burkholderia pyrrocinia TaxID=60550 RepID=UPI001FB43535|nr:hypothetical protein [Burkholderia pyrrocinia]UOB58290.1 hypothetical protein MRS60_29410 [Burkholderia pyrrocinia]